jgi:tetratricopeptide (TPR) repeat protein
VPQTVSLVDLLVEAQTLYTMAVDKQPESLTAALDLARQAQRTVADEAVRKRLPAGIRPDAQDLTVLGALRARISTLVGALEKRRDSFKRQYEDIQSLLQRKRLGDARIALDRLPADAPTADAVAPFADLRAELDRTIAAAEDLRTQGDTAKSQGLADDAVKLYRRAQAIDPSGADYDALCQEARDHASFLTNKRKEIRGLLEDRRLSSATREMAAIEALLPVDQALYQFEALRVEIRARQEELSATVIAAETAMASREYATAERLWREAALMDRDQLFEDPIRRAQDLGKASGPKSHKAMLQGILWTAVLAGTGVAAHQSMSEKYDEMYYFPPGSNQWWNLYDDAERMRKTRNGLYVAAFGVGTAFAIYGAVRANTSPGRSFSPFGPKTWVGLNVDPRRPSFMVVRIF